MVNPPDSWTQYQKLVLAELERHSLLLGEMREQLNAVHIEIATMKTVGKMTSVVFGFTGALVPVFISYLLNKN